MLGGKISRARGLLLVILAAVLILDGIWILGTKLWLPQQTTVSNPTDFTMQVWGTDDLVFHGDEVPELPMFQPATRQWMLGGQRVEDFAELVRGLEVGPHGSNPFVIVNLPTTATVDHYRQAIVSLSEQGICQVGVYSPKPAAEYFPPNEANPDWPPEGYVSVYRIVSVKPDSLTLKKCEDRFPPWRPS